MRADDDTGECGNQFFDMQKLGRKAHSRREPPFAPCRTETATSLQRTLRSIR